MLQGRSPTETLVFRLNFWRSDLTASHELHKPQKSPDMKRRR